VNRILLVRSIAVKSSFFRDLTLYALLVGSLVAEVRDNIVGDIGVVVFVGSTGDVLPSDEMGFVENTKFVDPVDSVLNGVVVTAPLEDYTLVP